MIEKRKYRPFASQHWENIIFLHWPVSAKALSPYVPKPFIIDTFNHSAWVSVVCFQATKSTLLYLPFSLIKEAIQINVRTYVKIPKSMERGVYFFRLYVNHPLAVIGANATFQLPFSYAMSNFTHTEQLIQYVSYVKNRKIIDVTLQKIEAHVTSNKLTQFLTERYCIWNVKQNKLIKIPIHHRKWHLQKAEVIVNCHSLNSFGIERQQPIAFFEKFKQSVLFPYETYGYYER